MEIESKEKDLLFLVAWWLILSIMLELSDKLAAITVALGPSSNQCLD